jgi:hypothetical protein
MRLTAMNVSGGMPRRWLALTMGILLASATHVAGSVSRASGQATTVGQDAAERSGGLVPSSCHWQES